MKMTKAAPLGDIFVTATGCKDVITYEHFLLMKHNATLCNSGHFNTEINLNDLEKLSSDIYIRRDNIVGYCFASGKTINVLAEGRLVNLAAGDGHPIEIMDTSFALQTLSLLYLVSTKDKLSKQLHDVPKRIDQRVARLKLNSMNITIDKLSDSQRVYLGI